jgi:hypothetical protein
MSLFEIFDNFMSRREQRLQQMFGQPQVNRVMYLREPQKRGIPLFGSDPESVFGFGYDAPKHLKGGVIPKVTVHNVEGINPDTVTPLLPPEKPYIDSAISPHPARSSEETDQQVIPKAKSAVVAWDGVVRNEPKKDFQGSRGHELTIGDRIAKEMKKEPYWFGA